MLILMQYPSPWASSQVVSSATDTDVAQAIQNEIRVREVRTDHMRLFYSDWFQPLACLLSWEGAGKSAFSVVYM